MHKHEWKKVNGSLSVCVKCGATRDATGETELKDKVEKHEGQHIEGNEYYCQDCQDWANEQKTMKNLEMKFRHNLAMYTGEFYNSKEQEDMIEKVIKETFN